jgi:hypothetical protein
MAKKKKTTEPPPEPEGAWGETIFNRRSRWRGDARLAARILSLGVVPEETVKKLLRLSFSMAAECAEAKDVRGYSACMAIPLAVAKLEQTEMDAEDRHQGIPTPPADSVVNVQVVNQVLSAPGYIEYVHKRMLADNGHASGNGHAVQPGIVEAGKAPTANRPDRNGGHR